MHSPNTPLDGKRLPSLDGWRAISIVLVLVQHSAALPGWPAALRFGPIAAVGGVGVRFFFVISGFLITWLMLKELSKTGKVCLKSFYVRRCLRILPVYFVYLASVALIQTYGSLTLPPDHWWRALTFTVNYGGADKPMGHLWTLAVEEQFYLLWPFLVALYCGSNIRRLLTCLITPVVLCPVLRLLAAELDITHPFAERLLRWHSFFTVCDGLAIGGLGAVAYTYHRQRLGRWLLKSPWLTLFIGATLAVTPMAFWVLPGLEPLQVLQDTLQCTGFLILLLHSVLAPSWVPYRPLNFNPVANVGILSYSLYLWLGLFDMNPALWPFPMEFLHAFPNWLAGVFAAAALSYFLIEKPALSQKANLLRALRLAAPRSVTK